MATALVRYRPHRPGLRGLLTSQGVRVLLHARAVRVAAAAEAGYAQHPPHTGRVEVQVDSETGRQRARATVLARHPGALPLEHEHRVLGGAIDAARSG